MDPLTNAYRRRQIRVGHAAQDAQDARYGLGAVLAGIPILKGATMDFATLSAFLVPALKALLPQVLALIPPTTPMGMLAQTILKILPMFGASAAQAASAPPVDLPPQSEWTPEGIKAHYEARCRSTGPKAVTD